MGVAVLANALALALTAAGPGAAGACPAPRAGEGYAAAVRTALASRHDAWGEALLRSRSGPSYDGARRHLAPLLFARAPGKRPLTASGVHYAAFSQPAGPRGAAGVTLHVADGSQILWRRVGGASITVGVGRAGQERYGSCLARLDGPRLAEGWLPILQTAYRDAAGARYEQESFAARRGRLAAFVRLRVDGGASVRLGSLALTVPPGASRTVHARWTGGRVRTIGEPEYLAARAALEAYWRGRLSEGAAIEVPEQRVNDALRNLLVQNLTLTWRYSIGNPYEQLSFPEALDVAQVMGEYGFGAVQRAILRAALRRPPARYPSWQMGGKLLVSAAYHRLHRDRAYVASVTPLLSGYLARLERAFEPSTGLLRRERYSSDIPDRVYGLHAQAVVWQGLREMAAAWGETGRPTLARRARALAARLEAGLRRAVRSSQVRLPDGSLFLPVRLLDRERPYAALTGSRSGSYWNLVAPYALASGLFRPGGPQAQGALRYLFRHGSRLLGLVRAGAYALYREPVHPVSGTDHVYGTNVARFLAANDEPDQLVLSLYGALAAAMTPGTFVAGEAASVAPLTGVRPRSMYLPPNGAANAATLATLRLMLVDETAAGGLRLAFATPRAWLARGGRMVVRAVPTSFGPVSFTLESRPGAVYASVDLPARARPRTVRLRLRLPGATRTVDLSGRTGRVELVVPVPRASS